MQNFTVIFAHGRESGPWGNKIRALALVVEKLGGQVISRDDTDTRDPELRVVRLIEECRSIEGPLVLVGSSMGGYVAAVASQTATPDGLFLMAPAFGLPGYQHSEVTVSVKRLQVVHGWDDDVVPLAAVSEFAKSHRAMLHLVPAGHALAEQLDWLARIFEMFLIDCLQLEYVAAREKLLATL